MDDSPIDHESFIFLYPVFVCMAKGPPVAIVGAPVDGGGNGIFVFTENRRQRFFSPLAVVSQASKSQRSRVGKTLRRCSAFYVKLVTPT